MKKEIGNVRSIANEFKTFAIRGNVVDLAVGIIIGGGFNMIVNSLVNDIVMPPIGHIIGKVDFKNLYFSFGTTTYPSLDAAKAAGAATINYGNFINNCITFVITAFAVFLLVRFINRLRDLEKKRRGAIAEAGPDTKQCPFCFTDINIKALRCPACTSALEAN